jgi:adenine-specific DNA-methyltransferase
MQKLDMLTPDMVAQNMEAIAQLFPNIITEQEDADGNITKAIDYDLFRQMFSQELVEGSEERYRLDWPGKRASILKANTPIEKTLRPVAEDSVNWDTTENLYIEWDNFEVLKVLQESYLGKVKMIYIDPPYNTGKDFVYTDNFKISKEAYEEWLEIVDEEGGKLVKNTDTNGRFHSDWLSMMYERLVVARDLLRDDGMIFMSIDDNEVQNLRKLADTVFWEDNFFADMIVVRSEWWWLAKRVIKWHDNLLVYAKSLDNCKGIYKKKDIRWKIVYRNNREYWIEEDWLRKEFWKYWTCLYEEIEQYKWREKKDEIDKWLMDGIYELIKKENWHIVWRLRATDEDGSKFYSILKHLNKNWVTDLEELKLEKFFDFPKPTSLLKEIIFGTTIFTKDSEEIILDFFSGSWSTAHAVMQLNAEDGGNRKFIMVQIPQETDKDSEAYKAGYKNICEIGKERIRRAGKKIIEENKGKEGIENLDAGFRVYRLDSSNMKDVFYHPTEVRQDRLFEMESNIKDDRTPEDILAQVMLDLGLTLDLPIETRMIAGSTVFLVAGNSLVACFDEEVDFSIVDELAWLSPLKVVFRDSSFQSDADRINFETRFKKLSPDSDLRVI